MSAGGACRGLDAGEPLAEDHRLRDVLEHHQSAVGEARFGRELGPMLASEVVLLLAGLPIALRVGRSLGLPR